MPPPWRQPPPPCAPPSGRVSPERLLWMTWHVGSLGFRKVPSFSLGRKIKQSVEQSRLCLLEGGPRLVETAVSVWGDI